MARLLPSWPLPGARSVDEAAPGGSVTAAVPVAQEQELPTGHDTTRAASPVGEESRRDPSNATKISWATRKDGPVGVN